MLTRPLRQLVTRRRTHDRTQPTHRLEVPGLSDEPAGRRSLGGSLDGSGPSKANRAADYFDSLSGARCIRWVSEERRSSTSTFKRSSRRTAGSVDEAAVSASSTCSGPR